MTEWKIVEKDGMPTEKGEYWIANDTYFMYPIKATLFEQEKHLVIEIQTRGFPSFLPIVFTHWIRIPLIPNQKPGLHGI